RDKPGITQASDLVRITEGEWTEMIKASGVGVPPGTPGGNQDEQVNNYVQQILRQVEAAFPMPFFVERLGSSPIATFLKSQPLFDLKQTYPEQFFQQNPQAAQVLTAQEQEQLRHYRRLYPLTNKATEAIALVAKGVRSAQQIAAMDATVFVEQHQDIFSADR